MADKSDEKGYVIAVCDDSDFFIPNAVHIERNDNLAPWVFQNDSEAAKGAERDGIKLINDMKGIDKGIYVDTPENRSILKDYLQATKESKEVYKFSADYARENDELAQYRKSNRKNAECGSAITKAVHDSYYETYHYELQSAAQMIVNKYGADRTLLVLANTIQMKDYDGRFSDENKRWGLKYEVPPHGDMNYFSDAHPHILDSFIDRARTASIVEYIIEQGTANTNEGNWIEHFDEIPVEAGGSEKFVNWKKDKIVDLLSCREEVAEVAIDGNSFDVCYYTDFCPNIENMALDEDLDDCADSVEIGETKKPSIIEQLKSNQKNIPEKKPSNHKNNDLEV